MKRYRPDIQYGGPWAPAETMTEDEEGDFVRYEDAVAAIEEARALPTPPEGMVAVITFIPEDIAQEIRNGSITGYSMSGHVERRRCQCDTMDGGKLCAQCLEAMQAELER